MTVAEHVRLAHKHNASDIHLICGQVPHYRIDRIIRPVSNVPAMSSEECAVCARELVGDKLDSDPPKSSIDLAQTVDGVRCRVNIFRQQGNWSIAIRLLNDHIPEIAELGLPPVAEELTTYGEGLVLVTGVTGSGKSTTLASILNVINRNSESHIITLEDPIEYVYTPSKCIINQREIGKDTATYASGLHEALREDPDIILLGEMRDIDTISTALTAAETGHLVFATIHSSSTADTIDRIIGIFPGDRQNQVRVQLSQTLKAVLNQNLFPRVGGGRVLATEVMKVTSAISAQIRDGKTHQITASIESSARVGNITMDKALATLFEANKISKQIYESFQNSRVLM